MYDCLASLCNEITQLGSKCLVCWMCHAPIAKGWVMTGHDRVCLAVAVFPPAGVELMQRSRKVRPGLRTCPRSHPSQSSH